MMLSNEFKINECDKCVYVKNTPDAYVIVRLYVDNMLVIDNSHEVVLNARKMLTKHYDMKDMGVTNKCTRSDNTFALNKLSRFTSNPDHDYWVALTEVLRYLKYIMTYGLHLTRYPVVLKGYCDAMEGPQKIGMNFGPSITGIYCFGLL
ncbi:uncharacterized protein LOC111386172 [Olea europaea var. sylvestris]|uniref:uncharacterized protein LOC111386172 n=1 Tax=Olea europaea var. sylvestris TaxID=158386 RepID=UPI000C1CE74C|nr:uncharacterized protein LOC111386172 [Olea europaea var. sylvestris]